MPASNILQTVRLQHTIYYNLNKCAQEHAMTISGATNSRNDKIHGLNDITKRYIRGASRRKQNEEHC